MKKARTFFKKIILLIAKPEMRILPGQLAFFLVMSLIPTVALIGTIASSLSIIDKISISIGESVPKEISDILMQFINGQGINFNISVFFISAFILASNGTHSMIITSNEIYKIESKNAIRRRIKAIIMIMILVFLLFLLLFIPVFGDTLFELIKIVVKNQQSLYFFHELFKALKYPVLVTILYIFIKLIYVIAPDKEIPSNTTIKGALFTTIGWIVATEIYAFYVGNFTKYDIFYGSISSLIILLIWIYILSYIFVLGMVINASLYDESV